MAYVTKFERHTDGTSTWLESVSEWVETPEEKETEALRTEKLSALYGEASRLLDQIQEENDKIAEPSQEMIGVK